MIQTDKHLGMPVLLTEVHELTRESIDTPGFGWEISEETRRDCDLLDHELRMGLIRSEGFIVG